MVANEDYDGHRRRLRERFQAAEIRGMHDYEILELLLTYAIPRRDVKPVSKRLIERFEGLAGVLDASKEDLRKTEGIGVQAAALIKLVKEIGGVYLARRMEKRNLLTSPEYVANFARMKLAGLPHEAFMAIFLNTQNEVLGFEVVNEGTIDQVAVYPRRIIEKALAHHASGILVAHNHPSGHVTPSEEDKRLTRSLQEAARFLDLRLLDHVVVGKEGVFSFLERGLLVV